MTELRFAAATSLIRIARHRDWSTAGADQRSTCHYHAPPSLDFDPANRGGCPLATVQKVIERRSLLPIIVDPVRIAALRFEKVLRTQTVCRLEHDLIVCSGL